MFKEVKERMTTVIHKISNCNKDTDIIKKKNKMEFLDLKATVILELKNITTKIKNSLAQLNSIFELIEKKELVNLKICQ